MRELRPSHRLHAVVFDDPDRALVAARRLASDGFPVEEAHTPYPVHGMDEALGMRPTRLGWATLVGGLVGGAVAFGFQVWTHAFDWPLNVGGKSDIAWPALIPVTFELVILLAAFATVGVLLIATRLWPRLRTPPSQPHLAVADDRFVLLVAERDGSFAIERFRRACQALGAEEVIETWRVV